MIQAGIVQKSLCSATARPGELHDKSKFHENMEKERESESWNLFSWKGP